jgi:formylglycine-generating enzyme required for sulfatase activity
MGSPDSETGRESDEGPQHEVTITKPFYIGMFEVTRAHWTAVTGTEPNSPVGGPSDAVNYVSWDDCQMFVNKLNAMGLGTFYLPTEAEWEYACRAGTTTRFYWGDDPQETQIGDHAWYHGNCGSPRTNGVGLKRPNPWGLYDMSGNAWEWCLDWYGPYSGGPKMDAQRPQLPPYHISRGGSCSNYAKECRSAYRIYYHVNGRYADLGFRLVREYP